MRTTRLIGSISGLVLALSTALPGQAQTFSSGSTGSLGVFAPASNTTVVLPADGVLNYTTVTIPSGVTVSFQRNAANTPVTMLATGDVLITGTIKLDGAPGTGYASSGPTVYAGGLGGPGGYQGGQSGARGATNNAPSAGQGPGGGAGSTSTANYGGGGSYGAASSFVSLLPLVGGSGGGGYSGSTGTSGISGGGGGGAILLASSTKITVNGSMLARGGDSFANPYMQYSGGGSGGAIRLVAPEIAGTGVLDVTFGAGGSPQGAVGRIRLEAFRMNFAGTTGPWNPVPSISTTCGPVTAASTPALTGLPSLRISAIGGVSTPSTTGGTYSTADLTLPGGTTNPVSVEVTGTNIPVGSTFKLKHIPQFAAAAAPLTATSTGSVATSTATFSVTLPVGQVSVLNAWSDFTLP
ncbi:MAG: hypothetical protein NW701_03340 [Nitrospira sp.]